MRSICFRAPTAAIAAYCVAVIPGSPCLGGALHDRSGSPAGRRQQWGGCNNAGLLRDRRISDLLRLDR
jgi:hypothetical protein